MRWCLDSLHGGVNVVRRYWWHIVVTSWGCVTYVVHTAVPCPLGRGLYGLLTSQHAQICQNHSTHACLVSVMLHACWVLHNMMWLICVYSYRSQCFHTYEPLNWHTNSDELSAISYNPPRVHLNDFFQCRMYSSDGYLLLVSAPQLQSHTIIHEIDNRCHGIDVDIALISDEWM